MDICFVGGVLSRVLAGKIGVARVVCEGRGNRSRVAQSQHPSDDNPSPGDLLEEINLLKRENEILRRQREASEEKNEEVAEVELGEIGEGGREISFTYLEEGNQPRVLPFLGVLSDISKDTLIAAPQLSEIEDPHWLNVLESFPGWNGAVVAVPGLAQVSSGKRLSVIQCRGSDIGYTFPNNMDQEVLVVIDASDEAKEFEVGKFYVWDCHGQLKLGWCKELPSKEDAVPVARLLVSMFTEQKVAKVSSGGFSELDPNYEF